ncbi:hypothetical protein L6R52_42000, partial [Myxococcota bacterium]|nr:hypothetical protein [Myxococcota bacterium]
KRWVAGAEWVRAGSVRKTPVPVLFADAKDVHRWLGWALLADVKESRPRDRPEQTLYQFRSLRPLLGHTRDELDLIERKGKLAATHIRPYVLFRTPSFLDELAKDETAPLLAEWLQRPEAVAHVFGDTYDSAEERRIAQAILARALQIIEEVAPGRWHVVLTPRRIRVYVGPEVAVDVGNHRRRMPRYLRPEALDDFPDVHGDAWDYFLAMGDVFRDGIASMSGEPAPRLPTTGAALVTAYLDSVRPLEGMPTSPRRSTPRARL